MAAPPGRKGWLARSIDRPSGALALLGGALLLALAGLVTVSVLRRWLTSQPINGDFELVQLGLALAIFAFLPWCQWRDGNIYVDTFTSRLPLRLQAWLDGWWALLYALVAALLARQLAIGAGDAMASGQTSMVLGLPIGRAIAACSVLAGFLAIVALATAARHAIRGEPLRELPQAHEVGEGEEA